MKPFASSTKFRELNETLNVTSWENLEWSDCNWQVNGDDNTFWLMFSLMSLALEIHKKKLISAPRCFATNTFKLHPRTADAEIFVTQETRFLMLGPETIKRRVPEIMLMNFISRLSYIMNKLHHITAFIWAKTKTSNGIKNSILSRQHLQTHNRESVSNIQIDKRLCFWHSGTKNKYRE